MYGWKDKVHNKCLEAISKSEVSFQLRSLFQCLHSTIKLPSEHLWISKLHDVILLKKSEENATVIWYVKGNTKETIAAFYTHDYTSQVKFW